jgi:tetratricopeptide (TPR) repeat protein
MYFMLEQYEQARKDLDQALRLNPNDPSAYTTRGIFHESQGEYQKALEDYNKVVELYPEEPQAYLNRGSALLALQAYDYTVAAIEQAIEMDPESPDAWMSKADALRLWAYELESPEKFSEGLIAVEAALTLEPESAIAHAIKGGILAGLTRYDEALSAFDQAIVLDPYYSWPYLEKGKALYFRGDTNEALETFRQLEEMGTEFLSETAVGQALALHRLDRFAEAEQVLQKALGTPPYSPDAFLNRATIFCQEFKAWEAAVADCRKAITLDQQLAEAHNLLAWIQADKLEINLEECTAEAEKAVNLVTKDNERGNCLDTLGWVWYKRGNLKKAQQYLREAIQFAGQDLLIRRHLEMVEQQLAKDK